MILTLLWFSPGLSQGTAVEGTIQQLFEGHHMNYIECINVDYKSTRKESFYGTVSQFLFEIGWGSSYVILIYYVINYSLTVV